MTQYYFNTVTQTVETEITKSQSKDLLGPYSSYAEASAALMVAHQKTEAWDQADQEWQKDE